MPADLAGIAVLAALALFDLLVSPPRWAAAAAVAVLAVLALPVRVLSGDSPVYVVAQAARAVPLDPAGAVRMLAEIEGKEERALEAMQQLVGVLRTAAAGSAPVATLVDLAALVARFEDAVPAAVEARPRARRHPRRRARRRQLGCARRPPGGRRMTIRVVIADDQAMVRAGFRMILDAQDGIEVVAEAADGVDALEAVRRLRPDVALLDIRMPRMNGLDVARALAADAVQVVVVTTFDLDGYLHAALRHGTAGFLLKTAGPALLVEAVRAAADGGSLISPLITVRPLAELAVSGGAGTTRREAAREAADRPHGARARRCAARRARGDQRGDRRGAVPVARHGEGAPRRDPGAAGGAQPRGDRRVDVGARADGRGGDGGRGSRAPSGSGRSAMIAP